jgi:hypothetical protein
MHTLLAVLLLAIASVKAGPRTITMKVPAGWRQLQAAEMKTGGRPVVLSMKRESEDALAPKAEIMSSEIPAAMRSMPLLERGQKIAASMFAGLGPTAIIEVEPRAIKAGGLPAVEWVVRFTLRGNRPMISRMIVVADGPTMNLITYAGPAAATADFKAFNDAVKSLTIK